jgi:hypothetical protein
VIPLHHPVTVGSKTGRGRARCSCRSGSCESQGKHPRTQHGLKDASCDPGVIRQWWKQWPRANVGLVTGVLFDVLDVDGPQALEFLEKLDPGLTSLNGPMVCTGRGWHLYVQATGLGNRAGLLPGVDWRGTGGYVVAPPSLHPSGNAYQWSQGLELELPLCPPWLLDLLAPEKPPVGPVEPLERPQLVNGKGYAHSALEAECRDVAQTGKGQRNHALNRAAFNLGQLVPHILDEHSVTAALTDAALRTGLSPQEIRVTITSGLRAGSRKPRSRT